MLTVDCGSPVVVTVTEFCLDVEYEYQELLGLITLWFADALNSTTCKWQYINQLWLGNVHDLLRYVDCFSILIFQSNDRLYTRFKCVILCLNLLKSINRFLWGRKFQSIGFLHSKSDVFNNFCLS